MESDKQESEISLIKSFTLLVKLTESVYVCV